MESYYGVLGVSFCSSDEEIRRAYRKLAVQWHPDKWTRSPAFLGQAKHKFQQIQQAYSVLSDKGKRMLYDAGLYDADGDEVEGFTDFLQELMFLINDDRKKEKTYSFEQLQTMFWEMAQSFDSFEHNTQRFDGPCTNPDPRHQIPPNEHLIDSSDELNWSRPIWADYLDQE